MHPEGYQCFIDGCRTKIKRRSAFVKHVKAKHGVDIANMSAEEVAAAVPLHAEKAATPPPDYITAAKARMYQEEELPTFQSDVVPKQEVYTPPSVLTPPPAVIHVIPSPDGFTWSPADFIGHTTLDTGIVCASPELVLLADSEHHPQPPMSGADCYYYQQPPAYYEEQWPEASIPIQSVAPDDTFISSQTPCDSGTDYNFPYDPNTCGDFNSPIASLRGAPSDMHYMTPTHMTSLSTYHFV